MSQIDLVTGAFSYSGSHIAQRLLDAGQQVRTLTAHVHREHPLQRDVEALDYRFDDPAALVKSLEGVSTLYNTYWVRFDRGQTTFANSVEHSRMLFHAARRAGVQRIVHVSITNPSIDSPLPYFRGKALVEYALAQAGTPYAIVRPTWLFGGQGDVLDEDLVIDAAGPERMSFAELVALVRAAVDRHGPVIPLSPVLMAVAARALGLLVGDVVLTPDEITGLTDGLLISHNPPRGQIVFSQWLEEHAASIGRSYANELHRHFAAHP